MPELPPRITPPPRRPSAAEQDNEAQHLRRQIEGYRTHILDPRAEPPYLRGSVRERSWTSGQELAKGDLAAVRPKHPTRTYSRDFSTTPACAAGLACELRRAAAAVVMLALVGANLFLSWHMAARGQIFFSLLFGFVAVSCYPAVRFVVAHYWHILRHKVDHRAHYVVTGHESGGGDYTKYVRANDLFEADLAFTTWLQGYDECDEVVITAVICLPGPPEAIVDSDGLLEIDPKPINPIPRESKKA